MYSPQETYTTPFLEYLSHAQITGFDFYLTVQEVGYHAAMFEVERIIREQS